MSESTGDQTVMVRYRIRFHREIIYSHLSTNPSMSQEEIAAAVAINRPADFLPQPWPPLSLDDRKSILSVSLIKMKAVVNVGLRLPEAPSALLTKVISGRFPNLASIPSTSSAIMTCETCITQDGAGTSSFGFSDHPLFKGESHSTLRNYVKAMLILGMQQYLESLG
jgi:hypothetical protein